MSRKWIVWYAILLHFVWMALIAGSSSALFVTATDSLRQQCGGRWQTAAALGIVASLALFSIWRNRADIWGLLTIVPQQLVMLLSAGSAIHAMWVSQFADGVVRPRAFIMTDQMPAVLAAAMHTMAIVESYGEAQWKRMPFRWGR